jgi:FixJ family two-component response regulator
MKQGTRPNKVKPIEEETILELISQDHPLKMVAHKLGLTEPAVLYRIKIMKQRNGVASMAALIRIYVETKMKVIESIY